MASGASDSTDAVSRQIPFDKCTKYNLSGFFLVLWSLFYAVSDHQNPWTNEGFLFLTLFCKWHMALLTQSMDNAIFLISERPVDTHQLCTPFELYLTFMKSQVFLLYERVCTNYILKSTITFTYPLHAEWFILDHPWAYILSRTSSAHLTPGLPSRSFSLLLCCFSAHSPVILGPLPQCDKQTAIQNLAPHIRPGFKKL